MDPVKFTLRFEQPETHELLRFLAARWGVSMNRLAEDVLARELRLGALLEEGTVLQTLERLRGFRSGAGLAEDIEAIARAEVEVQDPAEGRLIAGRASGDVHGIAAAFAS